MSDFADRRLPTYIRPDLNVLFCGINPGRVSATAGFHYAKPANLFWRGLHEGGLTPYRLAPQETAKQRRQRLLFPGRAAYPVWRTGPLPAGERMASASSGRQYSLKVANYKVVRDTDKSPVIRFMN